MSVDFFRVIEHLLPRARAWQIKLDLQMRQFFEGLTGLPQDARDFFDGVFADIFPDSTTQIDLWEEQWGLTNTGLTDAQRQARLDAAWKSVGGQSPRYLQDIVQGNGFNVFLHPWWEQPAASPPVAHNPNLLLEDSSILYLVGLDDPDMECGEADALLGITATPVGYPLVNKIRTSVTQFLGCDDPELECGEALAQCGQALGTTFGIEPYTIPSDPDTWPYFLYWGAETFPNLATVESSRRDEFEDLLLSLCPGQQWLGILVTYV